MCTGCGRGKVVVTHATNEETTTMDQNNDYDISRDTTLNLALNMAYAPKSKDPSKKVHLVYNGGGSSKTRTSGCHTCHGSAKSYSTVTNESIMFVSEDSPNGIYKEVCAIGHDYYVTEEQANYMLTLTYVNRSGQKVHKFTKKED